MRRAVLVLGSTAAGLTLLFSFKAHSLAAAAPAPSTSATPATASPAPAPAKSAAPAATRTITGPVTMTKYGPMQVKVTMAGQRITRITVLQPAGHGTESQRIASFSIRD
jgi:uncharacterized protein with FMN-binding domain